MTKDQMKEMAERIKDRRDALGYTQEQFAETIKLSASSYTKIENAFQKPALDTLMRIKEKLYVSLDYLVYGEDQPDKPDDTQLMRGILDFADPEDLKHTKDFIEMIIKAKMR